jgi:predicted nucleic acid-binding protein
MRTLYLRNVPDDVAERLERMARREGMSLSAFATRELAGDPLAAGGQRGAAGRAARPRRGCIERGRRHRSWPSRAVIVIDASAVVEGLLNDGEARAQLGRESVVCPHLADAEVAHAVREHVLREEVAPADGAAAINTWRRLGVERVGTTGLLGRIRELRPKLTPNHATYHSLAEALDVPLVTADGRLARSPGPRCTVTVLRS